jgi:4-diphosphocytidyl-2-C-methyl-D-erythritol kinase
MNAPYVRELAYAKLNLVLHVGRPRSDGLHPLCSLFASIELADEVYVGPTGSGADSVECPGVVGPNLATAALGAFRQRIPSLPPLGVRIAKRIPLAGGLGGGSADAAAVLRAANQIAGEPFDAAGLREIAAQLGSDVPSQVEPRHALVQGAGEAIEPIDLPPWPVVLAPQPKGLATAAVYQQLDRMESWRDGLDAERLRALARESADTLAAARTFAAALENDLQPAALALRPELGSVLDDLRRASALGALVSGSGPTCFGLFADRPAAEAAAVAIPGALVTGLRSV